jgi:beta-phosphoglucomutase
MLPLSEFRPRGVVFDLDGTLTDNMPCHAEAFAMFLVRHALPPLTMEMRERIDGKRNAEIFPILFGREISAVETQRFEEEKESAYRELSRDRLRPIAGVVPLLERLEARGIGVAVATSAPEKNVAHTLSAIGLADRLALVVRSDAVPRGKPHPDVFLQAARELGVPADACLAFEDAPRRHHVVVPARHVRRRQRRARRRVSRLRRIPRQRGQLAGELNRRRIPRDGIASRERC